MNKKIVGFLFVVLLSTAFAMYTTQDAHPNQSSLWATTTAYIEQLYARLFSPESTPALRQAQDDRVKEGKKTRGRKQKEKKQKKDERVKKTKAKKAAKQPIDDNQMMEDTIESVERDLTATRPFSSLKKIKADVITT